MSTPLILPSPVSLLRGVCSLSSLRPDTEATPTKRGMQHSSLMLLSYLPPVATACPNIVVTWPAPSSIHRGANGGLAGSNMRVISVDPSRKLTITGIDNHQMPDLDVVHAGAYVTSQKGPVIASYLQPVCTHQDRCLHPLFPSIGALQWMIAPYGPVALLNVSLPRRERYVSPRYR
jgi:hypothetical protein